MSLANEIWTILNAGNGQQYSNFPLGNPPAPSWTAIPNFIGQTTSLSIDIAAYVTPGSTIALAQALPSGWNFASGHLLTYDGTTVNGSPSSTFFNATLAGITVPSNVLSVQGSGTPISDPYAPTIPIGLAAIANTASSVTVQGYVPSDPSPPGLTWSGLTKVLLKRVRVSDGAVVNTSANFGPGYQCNWSLGEIGTHTTPSTLVQTGADLAITTTTIDDPYPTADGAGGAYNQITGTAWALWCRVDSFNPANAFSNIRVMARTSLAPGSPYVAILTAKLAAGGSGISSEARAAANGTIQVLATQANITGPVWLVLVRAMDTYSLFWTNDGNVFTPVGQATQAMGNTVFACIMGNTNDGVQISFTAKQATLTTLGQFMIVDSTVAPSTAYNYSGAGEDGTPMDSSFGNPISVTTPAAGGGTGRKFNPGWYMMFNYVQRPGNSGGLNGPGTSLFSALNSSGPNIKGILGFYYWGAIETGFGVYNWAAIDADLAYCKLIGKKYALLISPVNFNQSFGDGFTLPSYLLNNVSLYGAGANGTNSGYWTYSGTSGTYSAAMWRNNVVDRAIALAQAVAARYDGDPSFELFMLFEISGVVTPAPDCTAANSAAAYKRWVSGAVAAFPNTIVSAQVNFAAGGINNTADMVTYLKNNICGIGGPDVWGQSAVTNHGASNGYTWGYQSLLGISGVAGFNTDLRGQMVVAPTIEQPELDGSQFGGLGSPFSLDDLYAQADTNLHASHIFVTYLNGAAAGNWTTLLPRMNALPITHTSCPANLAPSGGCRAS